MVKAKINENGLGKAVIRKRFNGQRRPDDDSTTLHTTELNDGSKWNRMQSITQQRDLEDFLLTAEMQEKDFTAEKQNVKIITSSSSNPFLLSAEEESNTLKKHAENKYKLKVPRRPYWDESTTPAELHKSERESFLGWRRELARLEEDEGFLLTPFERNLEVWRQLWRVLERSHIIVQIVDARNPLLFRSEDLEQYIKELGGNRRSILLINKADMLNDQQRQYWADYFISNNIDYLFFSAKEATTKQENDIEFVEKREEQLNLKTQETVRLINELVISNPLLKGDDEDQDKNEHDVLDGTSHESISEINAKLEEEFHKRINEVNLTKEELKTKVLSPEELVSVLVSQVSIDTDGDESKKVVIGLVGYPNVGKSSTINSLVGAKKVSVGSMPGKTKHFQTIPLTNSITLCDCPGLVFPTFATTSADMVCNGVLPIDQLREYTGPCSLVAKRIPKWVVEATYGITIHVKSPEEGGDGIPTAEELLVSYAVARGLTKSSQGNPDESRAAKRILKDYVDGKLLFTNPPPSTAIEIFNRDLYNPSMMAKLSKNLIEDDEGNFVVKNMSSDRKKNKLAMDSVSGLTGDQMDIQFFSKKENLVPKIKGPIKGQDRLGFGDRVDNMGEVVSYISGVDAILQSKNGGSAKATADGKSFKKHKKGKKIKTRNAYEMNL
ncbi:Large subunit GTPase 1 [Smittium mucronatum]|uniref:Large subunit GTPase 1 n=1 Tax=Smittium mucronatum TaxID=133383 RepID=A0A1R0GPN6_9FUNG|nr:Large subunit GTPase 1 [Smittium mucronatum]OLY84138.1 Large subunit GTPase 1 [Smittium mucronatum]